MNMPVRRWGLRPWQRHSLVLTVAGISYFGTGLSYIFTTDYPARKKALVAARDWMPLYGWGYVFLLVGVLTLISSRWPAFAITWGYTTLTGLSILWCGFYLIGYLFRDAPATNFAGVLIWGLLGFLWWAISGLVNPTKEQVVRYGSY